MSSNANREAWVADPEWGATFSEIESRVGGRLTSVERQARWRPAFFCELERDGEAVSVYFRGDRGLGPDGPATLRREMQVLELLGAEGIPVPHIYGFCDSSPGILMEKVPGRANLATADSEDQRRAVLDHYLDLLADIHALDPSLFEKLGFQRPEGGVGRSLGDLSRWEAIYEQGKNQPEPLIELTRAWLRENARADRSRLSCLVGDSGQFLFDANRVTAVIDVELAALGDPVADLGGLLSRDLSEPLGDLSRGIARYRERTGDDFEARDVHYQAVRFCIFTPMSVCFLCAQPPPGLNLPQYESWNQVYGRVPLELIAHIEGVEIESPELPEPRSDRTSPVFDSLVEQLRDAGPSYAVETALRLAEYAREIDRRGARLEEQDREEAGAVLGHPVTAPAAAEAELEALAQRLRGEERAPLLRFLVRRCLRREALLGPALRELEGARVQRVRLG